MLTNNPLFIEDVVFTLKWASMLKYYCASMLSRELRKWATIIFQPRLGLILMGLEPHHLQRPKSKTETGLTEAQKHSRTDISGEPTSPPPIEES